MLGILKYTITVSVLLMSSVHFCMAQFHFGAEFDHTDGPGVNKTLINHLDYTTPRSLEFDSKNRPYMCNSVFYDDRTEDEMYRISTLRNGLWKHFSFKDDIETSLPEGVSLSYNFSNDEDMAMGSSGSFVVIDENDNLYALIRIKVSDGNTERTETKILFAKNIADANFNETFQIISVPSVSYIEMEARNSFNDFSKHPPVFAFITNSFYPYPSSPGASYAKWGNFHIAPTSFDVNGDLLVDFDNAVFIDDRAGIISNHSGGQSFAVTHGDSTYFVWLRHSSDPETDPDGNNETWINVINRQTNSIGSNRYVHTMYTSWADGHNQPTMGIDSEGYIHVLGGEHGKSGFNYNKSVSPLNIDSWSTVKQIGFARTYSSILIDNFDNMFSCFRASKPYKLYMQEGTASGGFISYSEGYVLVDHSSCDDSYRVFYHHMHKDRPINSENNRVYVSWMANCDDDSDDCDFYRVLAFTDDLGWNWKIPDRYDFLQRIVNGKSVQKIVFEELLASVHSEPFNVHALNNATEGDLPLAINYSIVSGNYLASISGNTITPTGGSGTIVVKAENSGNAEFYADEVYLNIQVDAPFEGTVLDTTIFPVYDSYVANSTYANSSFATEEALGVKNYPSTTRQSLLSFVLTSMPETVTKATLQLHPVSTKDPMYAQFAVKFVANDDWIESDLTWNNMPSASALLSTIQGDENIMEWDITEQVIKEISEDDTLSLKVESLTQGNYIVNFASSRNTDPNLWPRLIIEYLDDEGNVASSPSIIAENKTDRLRAYPNPVSNKVFINCSFQIIKVQITNVIGEQIGHYNNEIRSNDMEIDCSAFSNGVYIISVYGKNNVIVNKTLIKR